MKTILQKSIFRIFAFIAILSSSILQAQVTLPHVDPINYTVGQGLQAQTGWTVLNSGDDLLISSGNLSYTGLPASTGSKVTFTGAGIDGAKLFTQQTSGTVYFSFLLNVAALGSLNTTGGYFAGFTEGTGTNFGATLWTRSDGAGYDIGLNPRTTAANTVWSPGTTTVGTTVFVVMAYQMVAGATNDIVKIWINPTVGAVEPTATFSATNTLADLANVNRIFLRQDSTTTTPSIEMDEFRIGTTWNAVNPAPAGTITALPANLTDFGSINTGSNSASQSFVVNGSTLGANDIIVTAPSTDFQVSLDDAAWFSSVNITPTSGTVTNQTVYARFSPQAGGIKSGNIAVTSLNASQQNVAVSGTGVAATSNTSDIIENGSFTYPTDIDYTAYQATVITDLNSIEVAGFTIRDGGATAPDADTSGTELNSISFSLSNFANIRTVALYDGTTKLGEAAGAATVTFSGLTLTANDDSTKNFSLRVTFTTSVVDNQQFQFAVTAVTANVLGSTFSGPGTAVSSIAGNNNKIEVTATKIVYGGNAVTSVLNVAMTPSPTVRALDANNVLDLDYTSTVDITSTGTLAVSPTTVSAVAGVATFTNIVHTQTGLGLQLTAASGAFTTIASALFDVYNPIFANPITGTVNSASAYTTGQTVATNLTVSGIVKAAGLNAASVTDRFSASNWSTGGYDATKYFEFTLTPNSGYEIDFVNFIYTGQASGTGPTAFSFRSSLDNYVAEIGTPTALGANISLAGAAYQDVAIPVTFRIYGYTASGAAGTFSVNNFTFNGSVNVSPIPSISALPNALNTLDYFVGSGPSAAQSFNVNAASLSPAADDLTITASANFEVSTDNTIFGTTATISYTGGAVTNVPVYVRTVSGLALGTYTGNVTVTGGTAPTATVNVQGIVRTAFAIPYANSFRTQTVVNDAVAQGFIINNAVFNITGYEQLSVNGYIETPTIDFTQLSTMQVAFSSATFGGITGQTMQLQISTDNGGNYTALATFVLPSANFAVYKTNIDFAAYPSTTGKLRVQMTAGTNTSRFRDFYILNTTTWNGTAWSNGTPDAGVIATIEGDYNSTSDGLLTAKNLTVTTGNVVIASGDTMHLEDELTVNGGSVSFENNANLIQVNTATNTGNITVERDASLRRLDYVYWGAPVTGQNLKLFSPMTVSPPVGSSRFYTLDEATNNFSQIVDPTIVNFDLGKGYMIRAPNDFTTSLQTFVGLFTGVPHNGNVNVAVTRLGQGFNLIANPYPSPIKASKFFTANPTIGTIYLWTHFNQAAASGANYATYNATGTASIPSLSGSATPNGYIQTGQGFLINAPALTTNVAFTNLMREDNHDNQFFRNANDNNTATDKNRIWLNLNNATEGLNQTLIGYVDGATNDLDVQFDGKLIETEKSSLYNIINGEQYVIQGKALPFSATDVVPLGFKAIEAGDYTIAMDHFDGLFADGQDIFLKDNLTGITHNIKENPYTFTSTEGTFSDRFAVVYQNTTLGIENPTLDANSIVVYTKNNVLSINAGATVMQNVSVFDVSGRLLYTNNNVNASTTAISINVAQQVLVVQITSTEHKTVSKKVIF
ncbi:MAG: T9SS sorting signal type C domain-containing protein [Flavobacterium sp.]|nr:T9SS sorting signal type C domain-containing protein [Flavobacterium sp.]